MRRPSCGYIMTHMLWCKHNLFKKFLLFSKWGFLSAWNQNIFKTRFIIPEKSSSFWLKAPKKLMITIRNLWMGYQLRIRWSSLERFISIVWLRKGCHVFKVFFYNGFPLDLDDHKINGVATDLFCTGVIGHPGCMFLN